MSLVALGLASAQFLDRDLMGSVPITMVFSLFLVVSGMVLIVIGGVHYTHAREEIEQGSFLPSTRATIVGVKLAIVAGAMAPVLVILLRTRG